MRSTFLGLAVLLGLSIAVPAQAGFVSIDMPVSEMGGDIVGGAATSYVVGASEVDSEVEVNFTGGDAISLVDDGTEDFYFQLFSPSSPGTIGITNATVTLFGVNGFSDFVFGVTGTNGMSNLIEFEASDFLAGDIEFAGFSIEFDTTGSTSEKTYVYSSMVIGGDTSVVPVAAVPEPEAYASFALGAMVLGLGAFYSMRRKQELSVA